MLIIPAEGTNEHGSVVSRFHELWLQSQHRSDQAEIITWPDARSYLNANPGAAPADRLAVYLIDQRERWKRGEGLTVEEYLAADEEIARDLEMETALAQGEFSARRDRGELIDLERFAARFPRLCTALIGLLSHGDFARLAETRDLQDTRFAPDTLLPDETLAGLPRVSGKSLHSVFELTLAMEPGEVAIRHDLDSADLGFVIEPSPPTCGDPSEASEERIPGLTETARFAIQHPPLGKGGMGIVYKAYDRERREIVALKTMKRVEPIALYRFKNEFRTLADLSHPNLVSLYELIAVGDLWFFTMELVRGVDFIDYVRGEDAEIAENTEEQVWSFRIDQERRLRQALVQLVTGLIVLHDAGKLHRDIKPTNVLVTREGRVVLLDFGVSANIGPSLWQTPGEDRVVGTVGYIAPEQLFGSRLSTASDWYSVGVMLYFALTGQLPFSGEACEILVARQRSSPPVPQSICEGIPGDLNDLCVALLSINPRDRPDGRSVLARLAGACETVITHPRRNLTWSTIGREPHREILEACYQTVCDGRSVVLLVSGRSGSGKSMLIQSFLADLMRAEDVVVFAGRCHENESVPYKALDSVVDALSRYLAELDATEALSLLPGDISLLARMFPVLRRVKAIDQAFQRDQTHSDGYELRRRAITALRELLRRIGRICPLILAIDDLHWVDIENTPFLQELLAPPDPPLMLLIGSYCTDDAEASPLIQALVASIQARKGDQSRSDHEVTDDGPQCRELTVGPLTYTESRMLALELLDRRDTAALAAAHIVAKESGGNPYFIVELINAIPIEGELATRPLPPCHLTLDMVIWERIIALPDPARRLMDVIAVSGRPIRMLDAYEAASLDGDGRAATAILRSARLVRGTAATQRDEVETYHDWVRDTVLAHLSPEALAALHLRLAQVFENSDHADSETLALHFREAGLKDQAAEHYERAADKGMDNLAFAHASKLYRLVFELRTRPIEIKRAVSLWIRLGDSLANAGRGREASDAYLAAAGSADAAPALELKRRAAMQLLLSGNYDDGFALIGKGLQARGLSMPTSPSAALCSLMRRRAWLRIRGMGFRRREASQVSRERLSLIDLFWSAGAGLSNIEPISGADFQTRGLLLALKAGEPYRIARALTLEAATISFAGAGVQDRADALLNRAEELSNGSDNPHLHALVALGRGIVSLMSGSWRQADRWFSTAEPVLRQSCKGVAWELDTLHNLRLWALIHLGDLNEMRRILPSLKKEARERGDLYALTNLSGYASTLLRLAEDAPDVAESELNDAMACWSHRGFHLQDSAFFRARLAIHLYRGDAFAAWNDVKKTWPLYRDSLLPRIQVIRVQLNKLRAHCALVAARDSDNPAPLIKEAERAAQSLANEGVAWSQAYARLILAGVGSFVGTREMSTKALLEAAEFQKETEMTLCAAATLRRAGESLEGQSGRILQEAADAYFRSQGVIEPSRFTHLLAPDCIPCDDRTPTTLGDRWRSAPQRG